MSKSEPQHEMMSELGFKLVLGFKYSNTNRIDPGDYTIYRAADYLGNDSIYRCMRINDDTDTKFIALKKDRLFHAKARQQNKIVLSLNEVVSVSETDKQYLACAACKRIFRLGNFNKYLPVVGIEDPLSGIKLEWEFKNIVCCDKHYAIGANPRIDGDWLAFCVSSQIFRWGRIAPGETANDSEMLIVDYLVGRKEAKKVVRDR